MNAPGREAPTETRVLLLSARMALDDKHERLLAELLADGLDWTQLTQLALRHQVLPLVAAALTARHRDDMPPRVAAHLIDYTRAHAVKNLALATELIEILDAFERSRIPAFPYKGPALAVAAYGSLRYRTFGDLDILVPKREFLRAKAVLEGMGFQSTASLASSNRYYLRHLSAHAFRRGETLVDLQWASTYLKALSIPMDEDFWDRTQVVEIAGRALPALAPEVLFLFLCAHGARHHWDRLKWVCDITEMVRSNPDLDWDRIRARAHDVGAQRVLDMSVIMASTLLDAPLPEEVLLLADGDAVASRLATTAATDLLASGRDFLADGNARLRFRLSMKERWRDRFRYLAQYVTQPMETDYQSFALPRPLWFLYPIVRPMRIVGRRIVRRVRSEPRESVGNADRN